MIAPRRTAPCWRRDLKTNPIELLYTMGHSIVLLFAAVPAAFAKLNNDLSL